MLYSIVIPVYNSETIIRETVLKTREVARQFNLDFEIILIDDASLDSSWTVIKKLAKEYENVRSLALLKNYGQHTALLAGLSYARGDYAVTMDDDMQNPPAEIIKLIEKIEKENCDLVFAKFTQKKHSLFRCYGTKIVGYLNKKIFNKPDNITLSNFRIIRRDLIDRILTHRTFYPYIPGLLLIYSAKVSNVEVSHSERLEGRSNYTISRIISLVSRLLINYSSYPLRILSMAGLFVSLISFLIGTYYLIKGIYMGSAVQGWTTLIVLISFLGGFIIALLGIIGEYLSRILEQQSDRSCFILKEVVE